jgi:hypothetical protein
MQGRENHSGGWVFPLPFLVLGAFREFAGGNNAVGGFPAASFAVFGGFREEAMRRVGFLLRRLVLWWFWGHSGKK